LSADVVERRTALKRRHAAHAHRMAASRHRPLAEARARAADDEGAGIMIARAIAPYEDLAGGPGGHV
jgi:hypothetical protein